MSSSRRPIVILGVVIALFAALLAWRASSDDPGADSAVSPTGGPDSDAAEGTMVGYVTSRDGTGLAETPGGTPHSIARGVVLPVLSETDDGFEVFDTCNRDGWVAADSVDIGRVPVDRNGGMSDAVFVIDAGHGFPDLGAVGPSGYTEREANIDVAARLTELLSAPRDIDHVTGAVTPGSAIPAARVVVATRAPDGPEGGDYELGLTYRATIGNTVDATAALSLHHNTEPTRDLDQPGSTAFVSAFEPESARLGGLIVAELRTGLGRFEADWVGGQGDGLTSRVGSDGDDYYTFLAVSEVPAVIVEGAYISNPSEEALIMTREFRQAYAEAVYRALARFMDGESSPLPAPEPEPFDVEAPPRSMDDCVVPRP